MMLDIVSISAIKSILKKNNLWAKKSLGQSFLVDKNVLNKIIEVANLSKDDVVMEIGPGLGVLTDALAQKAKLVLAIEKDYKLVEFLRKRFKNQKNIKIIHDDILTYDLFTPSRVEGRLRVDNYKVVANLPYNITSPVIRKFLESENKLSDMILMVQKEVAERLTAKPGDSNRGITTVMVEFYGQAEIIQIVPRSNFWPVPAVDSAIVKIVVKHESIKIQEHKNKKNINHKALMRLVKIGFSQKRRKIYHPLISGLHLSKLEILDILKKADIDCNLRAEDLKLDDWVNLYNIISKNV